MIPDFNTLPISGSVVLALFGYAAFSAFVTGPEVAHREIARSDWPETCVVLLEADLKAEAAHQPNPIRSELLNVTELMNDVLPELGPLWEMIPDPRTAVEDSIRQNEVAADIFRDRARAGFDDRCFCAESGYLSDAKLDLALYAGSGRAIRPQAVKNREAELTRALRSPICAPNMEMAR